MTELGRAAKDDAEAARWYQKAAEAGHLTGMERYAYFAEHGRGGSMRARVRRSSGTRKRPSGGNPAALTRMGILSGEKKLLKRAVDAGYAPAMTALAKMQPEDAKSYTKRPQHSASLKRYSASAK